MDFYRFVRWAIGLLLLIIFLTIFLWMYDVSVSFYQVFVVILVMIISICALIVRSLMLEAKSIKKSSSGTAIDTCKKWWSERTNGEQLTFIGSLGRRKIFRSADGNERKEFMAFLFERAENSGETILMVYSIDDDDVWEHFSEPDAERLKDPFHLFMPFGTEKIPWGFDRHQPPTRLGVPLEQLRGEPEKETKVGEEEDQPKKRRWPFRRK